MRLRILPALSALLAASCLLAAATPPARAAASEWSENPESKVRLITPYRVAPMGRDVWLGLQFELSPEWHVYWKNSGDAGFPPVIDLAATPELGDAELRWPAPERYELPGDLVAFGYEDEVVYPIRATLGDGVADPVEIVMVVDYLVCQIDCIPYRYTLRLEQSTGPEPEDDPETAPLLARWRKRLPRPAAEVAGVETRGWLDLSGAGDPVLQVTVDGARAAPGERPGIFLESHEIYDVGTPEIAETAGGLRFRLPLEPLRVLDDPPPPATFAWTITGLALPDAGASPHAIEARQTVPAGTEDPGAGGAAPESGPAGASGAPLAKLLVRAFLGGLVLALTPAALALLLVCIGQLRYGRGTGGRALSSFAGTAAAALVLAAAALAAGPGASWTRLLQQPVAVTALALVALVFALRLWGLVGPPGRTAPEAATDRVLRLRGFGAGLLLPLLALAWPVPPAAGAIDGALAAGPVAGLAAALLAAVGLALPLALPLVLARTPSGSVASWFVPRRRGDARAEEIAAGRRSPSREAFGFLVALSVVWLLYVLSGLIGAEDLAFVQLCLLGVGLAGWAGHRSEAAGARGAWAFLALAAAAAGIWLAAGA